MTSQLTNFDYLKNLKIDIDSVNKSLSELSKFSGMKIDFSSIEGISNTFKSVDTTLINCIKNFSNLGSFNENMNTLAQKGSVLATAYNAVNNVLLGNIATLNLQTIATSLTTAASDALIVSLNFLKNNPLIALAGAVGILFASLSLLKNYENEEILVSRKFYEEQAKKREELDKVTESLKENSKATKENVDAINADYTLTLNQIDQLVSLTGQDGYVKNINEAKYLMDQINSILPNTVELTDEGKIVWKDLNGEIANNTDKIKENIESLKQRAIVEAYQEQYTEAIKNEVAVTTEKIKAQNALEEAEKKYSELKAREKELTAEEQIEYGKLKVNMDEYRETISSCDEQLVCIQEATNNYTAAQKSLSGTTEDMADFLIEQYAEIDKSGKHTWESLGSGLIDLDEKIKAHNEGTKEMTAQEIESHEKARDKIVNSMIEKAKECEYSYDQMISILEEEGVYFNEQEKELFKTGIENIENAEAEKQKIQKESLEFMTLINNSGLSNLNEDTKKKLETSLEMFRKCGETEGIDLCKNLATNIKKNDGQVNTEMMSIVNGIIEIMDNTNFDADVTVIPPHDKDIENVKNKLNTIPSKKDTKCFITAEADKKSFSLFGIKIPLFSYGGFPETGELFIAREAGPELVGRINGKTAVANNDQIISGISSGVYNAVRSAIQSKGSGDMNIHATFVMDGEVIGKQVIKYHNGVVRRTGATPLML